MRHTHLSWWIVTLAMALVAAACGDNGNGGNNGGSPTPGPILGEVECESSSDSCEHAHTTLFAIAHSFNDPDDTVLYRVTVPAWPTGTAWGDGTNGFFYRVTVTGHTTKSFTYVPFSGMAVGSDNQPMLPQFSFIVAADVANGESSTTMEIEACATNYAGGSSEVPGSSPCTRSLWSPPDTYTALPSPSVGPAPFTGATSAVIEVSGATSLSLPNNGVYPGVLIVQPSKCGTTASASPVCNGLCVGGTDDGTSCKSDSDCDSNLCGPSAAQQWLYDHLVFFDLNGDPYTNDIFEDTSTSHRSIGVLSLEEAGYLVTGGEYRTRYGLLNGTNPTTEPFPAISLPAKQFFFYTKDGLQPGTEISVGAQFIYDEESDCRGNINDVGNNDTCAPSSTNICCNPDDGTQPAGLLGEEQFISPAVDITPDEGVRGGVNAFPANQNTPAGSVETRTIEFQSTGTSSKCTKAVNPLAVYKGGLEANRPNYIIDETLGSGTWGKGSGSGGAGFPPGLYYVLPAGFGNCASDEQPFCHLTSNYTAYVPHYTSDPASGATLNGGSTDQPLVESFAVADYYQAGSIGASDTNYLVWFDNCGFGYTYCEKTASSATSCANTLGSRKDLPSPPSGHDTYTYTVTNSRPGAVVFGKDCCATYYQEDSQSKALLPPEEIHSEFAVFVPAGQSLTYKTLFSDEAIVAYDAATGNVVHKLRLNPTDGAVYSCADSACNTAPTGEGCPSVGISGTGISYTVDLGGPGHGSLGCALIGDCPFGMTVGGDSTVHGCTQTGSSFLLGVKDWAGELSLGSLQLRAWGGSGAEGRATGLSGCCNGAAGGAPGFAMTVVDTSDLAAGLYAYVGAQAKRGTCDVSGASSTILTTKALSAFSDMSTETLPANKGILLIAGGSGSGGTAMVPGLPPGTPPNCGSSSDAGVGGSGGVAIANSQTTSGVPVNGAGGRGGNCNGCSGSEGGGQGGNQQGDGDGQGSGTKGIGGWGDGDDQVGWRGGTLILPASWSLGRGGQQSSVSGVSGPGAGGFGGGGEGGIGTIRGSGGGAGGCWAAANTTYDSSAPTSRPAVPSAAGSNGVVELAYPRQIGTAVAARAQLTSTGHPEPTDCLHLPSDQGTVLDNGYLKLIWQGDGNLVLQDVFGNVVWSSEGDGSGAGTSVCFQGDGNFVIYDSSGPVGSMRTEDGDWDGDGGQNMILQGDCNLVIRNSAGSALWATGTNPCK